MTLKTFITYLLNIYIKNMENSLYWEGGGINDT